MRQSRLTLLAMAIVAALALTGCAQAAPAPAATAPPAAPKAAEPTKAPAAAPTVAPTASAASPTAVPAKVDYPARGKSVQVIVPFSAGGGSDVAMRLILPYVEKIVGIPFEVVNKPGASTQTGMTELAKAKPDGYTIGVSPLASMFVTYLDPDRKAVYTRKDFQPIANVVDTDNLLFAKGDAPYKTLKDVVDAAKANPGSIKFGDSGILGNTHLVGLSIETQANVKFAFVHFGGGGEVITAVLGNHIDVGCAGAGETMSQYKSGAVKVLATSGQHQSKFFPDVKNLADQGFPAYNTYSIGLSAPAGTPKEIVEILTGAVKKALGDAELQKKLGDAAYDVDYMDPTEYAAYWAKYESQVAPLIELGKKSN